MNLQTLRRCALVSCLILPGSVARANPQVELFPLADVRLLDGPFKSAQDVDERYIVAHDLDRLLAPFRREAGLPKKAEPYGNWESSGLDGHTAGHYLSAVSMMYASTGDAEMKRRMDYMVSELADCQKANGNGYVGGVPNSRQLWADVAAGRMKVNGFGVNDRWVPWYNLHKLYAGLRDAYTVGKNEQAKTVLVGLADWCVDLLSHLSDEQVQRMLSAEHGGMAEVLADVYAITGQQKYLDASRRFIDHRILDPLIAGRDDLTGKHANTQIPKIIGYERIASLSNSTDLHLAATRFWENVTTRRSVSIGGNSVGEHFHAIDNFKPMVEDRTGPETCNTYNMLRLTEALFEAKPQQPLAEFYERALFNHILSSENLEHGGFVYFTPMRPNHYRVYSTAEKGFWCCVGTGFENHAKYGRFIYAHDKDSVWVNLFMASELNWEQKGVKLKQVTSFPDEPRTKLLVSTKEPATFTMHIRKPSWLASAQLAVRVNGEAATAGSDIDGYVSLNRTWKDGDRVEIDLPMKIIAERLPDGSNFVSFKYGPVVLAAATGTQDLRGLFADDGRGSHVAEGPLIPLANAPTLMTDDITHLAEQIKQPDPKKLAFSAPGLIEPASYRDLQLVPFYRVHESRYVVYFPVAKPAEYAQQHQDAQAAEQEKIALDKATIDQVTPGAQQSEVDHAFKGESTNNGTHMDRGWRDATGWFSYEVKVPADTDADLLLTFYGGDTNRKFDVLIGDDKLASISLDGGKPETFIDKRFPIPKAWNGQTATIKFVAADGSIAGGLFGLRVVRRDFAIVDPAEKEQQEMDKITLDRVYPGLGQSETDHAFKADASGDGTFKERQWRDAHRWFSYDLKIPAGQVADLAVTFYGGDVDRRFDIQANGKKVASVNLDGSAGDRFITQRFPLDKALAGKMVTIKFVAAPGSVAGGVYDVRLVKHDQGKNSK